MIQRFFNGASAVFRYDYLTKFVPHISDIASSLRELLEKDSVWIFYSDHKNLIDKLEKILNNNPVLKILESKLSVKILLDAFALSL